MDNFYGMDKKKAELLLIEKFNLKENDYKINKNKNGENERYFDFVGFIFNRNEELTVFPVNMFSNSEISSLNSEYKVLNYKKLLADTIFYYIQKTDSLSKAYSHLGEEIGFNSNYPFKEFFEIYKYYNTMGLYREERYTSKMGTKGKIDWKETIRKSPIVISSNNLIFTTFFSKHKVQIDVFMSECMAFVINYTAKKFSFLFNFKQVQEINPTFQIDEIESIIIRLYEYKNQIFKDKYISLINNLIEFFIKLLKLNNEGGNTHIKIKYFNDIWQDMVNDYINVFLEDVDKISGIKLSHERLNKLNFEKKVIDIDFSKNNFRLEFDHYAEYKNLSLLFDSKYYNEINRLDYKQIVYTQMLTNNILFNKNNSYVYSTLILPTNVEHYEENFLELKDDYIGNMMNPVITILYLNIRRVMESYIPYFGINE